MGCIPACVEACKVGALTYGEVQDTQVEKGIRLAQAVLQSLPGEGEAACAVPETIALWRGLS